jgi:hypothetical protein
VPPAGSACPQQKDAPASGIELQVPCQGGQQTGCVSVVTGQDTAAVDDGIHRPDQPSGRIDRIEKGTNLLFVWNRHVHPPQIKAADGRNGRRQVLGTDMKGDVNRIDSSLGQRIVLHDR